MVLPDLRFHILIIHPVNALCILLQLTVYHLIAIVLQTGGKANICRAVQKDRIPWCRQALQCRKDPSEDTILIANILFFQSIYTISFLMPFDNFIKIGISRCKISVSRMFCTFNNGLRNRRHCRKVHIRHPHRDKIKTSLWF